jgi:hypothetical protein
VGLAILGPLRDFDEVAYLRFASVYRGWESLDDFEKEIAALRGRHQSRAARTTSDERGKPMRGNEQVASAVAVASVGLAVYETVTLRVVAIGLLLAVAALLRALAAVVAALRDK